MPTWLYIAWLVALVVAMLPAACTICCGGGTVTCIHCPGSVAAAQWCFTLTGLSDGFCTSANCAGSNGSYTMTYQGNCIWQVTGMPNLTGACATANPLLRQAKLQYLSKYNQWAFQLWIGGVYNPISAATFNCVGSNTFTSPTVNPNCHGTSSVTLTPC